MVELVALAQLALRQSMVTKQDMIVRSQVELPGILRIQGNHGRPGRVIADKIDRRNDLLFSEHSHHFLVYGTRCGTGILRKQGKYHDFLHFFCHHFLNRRLNRWTLVAHGQFDDIFGPHQLLNLFHQAETIIFEGRSVFRPEFLVCFGRFTRAEWRNNTPHQQISGNRVDVDDPWIEQKLFQITVHCRTFGLIGCAQVDNQNSCFSSIGHASSL